MLLCAALALSSGVSLPSRPIGVRPSKDDLPLNFIQLPSPDAPQGPTRLAQAGVGSTPHAPQSTVHSTVPVLVPSILAVALLAASARRGATSRRRDAGAPQLRAGSVENKKFMGDWATLAPSTAKDEVPPRELHKSDLGNGITELRGIYSAGTERYGEEFSLNQGSTDNAYLITPACGAPPVLIGIHDEGYAADFTKSLGSDSLAALGVVVLQYFDGKQVGTVQALVEARPEGSAPLTVYCTDLIASALKKKLSEETLGRMTIETIEDNTTLEIEEGRTMKFLLAPTPKTPEACVCFDPQTGTVFSGKFFAAHRAVTSECSGYDAPGTEGWEAFADDWFHLFDCYFFTQNAQTAIHRLFRLAEALHGPDVEQLAPMHGPVVREQCWKLMAKYEAWTAQKLSQEDMKDAEVLVMYASAYGHTKTLANAVADGLKSSGVNINMLDLEHVNSKEVSEALQSCNGFFLGSPTLGGEMPTQVKEALGVVLSSASAEDKDRVPCGVFGSYGWSGEAVDEMHFRLKDGGFPFVCDPIRVRFRPTNEQLDLCKEAGVRMQQKLRTMQNMKQESRARKIDEEVVGTAAAAFGKMRSSRCAISTKDPKGEDVVTPITWVNQASFDPPGITVAVAKKDLDPFLNLDTDEQLDILFKRYDEDGGGTLDREELTLLLKDLFGVGEDPERAKIIEGKIDDALNLLDEDGDGAVDIDEIRAASKDGPLAETLEKQRKLLALEQIVGKTPEGDEKDVSGGLQFVLNLLPGDTPAEAISSPKKHKKGKPANGCLVLEECNAYLECAVTQTLNAGDHTILLAQVVGGKVLKANDLTELVSVVEKQDEKKEQPAMAMAAFPARAAGGWGAAAGASAGRTGQRAALAGAAGPSAGFGSVRARAGAAPVRAGVAAAAGERDVSGFETWTGLTPGKEYRLQTMTVPEVAADTTTIRSLDWDRDRFDIEFALERGTTYNAYVIKGAEKTAIVDTSHEKFEGLFFEALDKEVDYATVSYLIVSHTEPDHSGLISKVVEKAAAAGNEDFTIVGSKVCIQFLQNLIHSPFKSQTVGNNDKIDLGGGHELEFVVAPNLHWPDTIFTFDHGTGLLYTCDAFGMHYCSESLVDTEGVQELMPHYSLYYECLMKPNARSVLTALKKTKGMDFHTIATGHGPMLKEHTTEWVEQYRSWSDEATQKVGPSVAIFWVSNYGESERLSQVFAHGLTTSGISVEMHDLNAVDAFELTECLVMADVLAVMCPPQGSNAAQGAIGSIVAGAKEKSHRFMILESGAEDQEPVDLLMRRFAGQNIPQVLPAMTVGEGLGPTTMQSYEEAGMSLGKLLTQKAKANKAKSLDKDMEAALGRLASSLYVITAKKAGLEHAMVASWVTPASQSPLGISVAIAKDRAMEPLLRVGDAFNVNFLEEGSSLGLMKHFLQKFAPGQNRLAGIEKIDGSNGAAVLREACAYLECRIISRMDCTDHWVAYAEVTGGNVAKQDAELAVHHRKTGTYY